MIISPVAAWSTGPVPPLLQVIVSSFYTNIKNNNILHIASKYTDKLDILLCGVQIKNLINITIRKFYTSKHHASVYILA